MYFILKTSNRMLRRKIKDKSFVFSEVAEVFRVYKEISATSENRSDIYS